MNFKTKIFHQDRMSTALQFSQIRVRVARLHCQLKRDWNEHAFESQVELHLATYLIFRKLPQV